MANEVGSTVDYGAIAAEVKAERPAEPKAPKEPKQQIDYAALAEQVKNPKPPKHPELTDNSGGEGIYLMRGKDGNYIDVPYSKVGDAVEKGYGFGSDDAKTKFSKDYSAGRKQGWERHQAIQKALGSPVSDTPWNRTKFALHATGKDLQTDIEGTPIAGAKKEVFKTVAGLVDILNKSDEWATGEDYEAYRKEHPHATESEVEAAVTGHDLTSQIAGHPYRAPEHMRRIEEDKRLAEWLRQGTDVKGFWENVGALGEQVAEIALPESWLGDVAKGARVGEGLSNAEKVKDIARFLDKYPKLKGLVTFGIKAGTEGARGAAEIGTQQYVKSGGKPEEAKAGAEAGAVGGAAGTAVTEAAAAGGKAALSMVRGVMDTGESNAAEVAREAVKKAGKAEEEAARKNAEAAADHLKKVREAEHETTGRELKYEREKKTAEEEAAEKNLKAAEDHQREVEETNRANEERQREYEAKVQEGKDKAQADYDRAVSEAKESDTKRGQLARKELVLRDRLWRRVQRIKEVTKINIDGQWDRIRAAVGTRTTPLQPLVETVEKAQDEFKGSQEKIKEFQDILKRSERDGSEDDLKEATARSNFNKPYIKLDTRQRALIDRAVKEAQESYYRTRGEEFEDPTIDFTHLRGYSSELGKLMRSRTLDGDVRQAIGIVKDKVDQMAQKLADDAGVGAKLRKAKDDYKKYIETFYESAGVSHSGSQMAQAVSAADSFYATEPFLEKEAAPYSRARKLLIGEEGSPHYDPNAGKLLDELRKTAQERDNLPKPKVPKYEEPKKIEPPKMKEAPKAPEPVKPREVAPPVRAEVPERPQEIKPEYEKVSPETLQKQREESVYKFAKRLQHFGPYMATSMATGIVGGLASLASTHDPFSAVKIGGEFGAVGLFAPYALRTLLEKPWVIEKLTRPTIADLKQLGKLPAAQKENVEAMLAQLSIEAERTKVLRKPSPWLRIVSGETIKKVRDKMAEESATSSSEGDKSYDPDAVVKQLLLESGQEGGTGGSTD